jgi:hypothetical protein
MVVFPDTALDTILTPFKRLSFEHIIFNVNNSFFQKYTDINNKISVVVVVGAVDTVDKYEIVLLYLTILLWISSGIGMWIKIITLWNTRRS